MHSAVALFSISEHKEVPGLPAARYIDILLSTYQTHWQGEPQSERKGRFSLNSYTSCFNATLKPWPGIVLCLLFKVMGVPLETCAYIVSII